ncbi:hypothetical protein [Rhizobium herbae]|uniref:Uncharacterized protein n=1 Tax=Rhizobium herbae TaxID=508661 RepID=A0ABS4EU72_9HYPH|nr:hypothetical protein [Rhizobium herbae]MBP1861483.1 hypothetical protein [Rhizobium herbae]
MPLYDVAAEMSAGVRRSRFLDLKLFFPGGYRVHGCHHTGDMAGTSSVAGRWSGVFPITAVWMKSRMIGVNRCRDASSLRA